MVVELLHGDGWAKTYLLHDGVGTSAALVDPVYDFLEEDLAMIEERGLSLTHAIATHTHADHITACFEMRERTGCSYVMWKDTASLGVSELVDESTACFVGDIELRFHYAPGHTSDSMIIETDGHILTGDFLFTGTGGVGRDDLPSGRVDVHWEALRVLERFPGSVVVCTGHDPPGTEMQTLEWNRQNNPVLGLTDLEAYRTWQAETSARLGGVSKIKVALPANLFGELPSAIPWLD